jgi:arylamine N-acetyltransferase
MLCGADMSNPDSHLVNVVNLENRQYLLDVGYAAPFLKPIPLDLQKNYQIEFGADRYVLLPKDNNGHSKLQLYRNNELKHGYKVKPYPRSKTEFDNVIKNSFRDSATFFNAILLVKYNHNESTVIHNFSLIESNVKNYHKRILSNTAELADEIVARFGMKKQIVQYSLNFINNYNDAWN